MRGRNGSQTGFARNETERVSAPSRCVCNDFNFCAAENKRKKKSHNGHTRARYIAKPVRGKRFSDGRGWETRLWSRRSGTTRLVPGVCLQDEEEGNRSRTFDFIHKNLSTFPSHSAADYRSIIRRVTCARVITRPVIARRPAVRRGSLLRVCLLARAVPCRVRCVSGSVCCVLHVRRHATNGKRTDDDVERCAPTDDR